MNSFKVGEARIDDAPNGMIELSGSVGGERCWFRVPRERGLELRGEPFLIAGLLPAMQAGLPLELDDRLAVCPTLLDNLYQIQRIFRLWGPDFNRRLIQVPIHAATAPAPPGREVASFFTGGVDSTYTSLEAPVRPEVAMFVRGIDFQLDNPIYDESFARNRDWLARRDIKLLAMDSNIRWVGHSFGLGWFMYQGAGLSAIAHVSGFSLSWVSSDHSWKDLLAEGVHPCSDPHWSSATRELRHHGRDSFRWEKLARIAEEPGALDLLRVCWQDKGFNCGKCDKCVRTMTELRLLGLKSPNFPPLEDLSLVAKFKLSDQSEALLMKENLELAIARGDSDLKRALQSALRRWELGRLARDADRLLLGGMLKRLRSRLH